MYFNADLSYQISSKSVQHFRMRNMRTERRNYTTAYHFIHFLQSLSELKSYINIPVSM
jgi:hypothetical protein